MDIDEKEWQDNGAIHILQLQFIRLKELMDRLISQLEHSEPELEGVRKELNKISVQDRGSNLDVSDRFFELVEEHSKNFVDIHEIFNLVDIVTLMICIELEMRINKFCYYNIGEETTEAIESLSLIKKLTVAHAILGNLPFKGGKTFQLLNKFVKWRNMYVHGKRPNIRGNQLHKNHFAKSGEFDGLIGTIKVIIKDGEDFLKISKYLSEVSNSEYTNLTPCEDEHIEWMIDYIKSNLHRIIKI